MRVFLLLALFVAFVLAVPQSAAGRHDWDDGDRRHRPRPRPHGKCLKYWDLCHEDWDTCHEDDEPPAQGPPFDFPKLIKYATATPGCNPFVCLGVLAVAPCIVDGMRARDAEAVTKCSSEFCGCTACIPGLDDFEQDNGLCG